MDRSTREGDSNDCSGKHGHVLTLPSVRKPIGMNVDVMAPTAQRSKIQKSLETLEIILQLGFNELGIHSCQKKKAFCDQHLSTSIDLLRHIYQRE
jgi:hypothetical protein